MPHENLVHSTITAKVPNRALGSIMITVPQESTEQIDEIDSDKTISESSDDELSGSRESETLESNDHLANKLKANERHQ